MKVVACKTLLSRADVQALPPRQRKQFVAAAAEVVGRRTLAAALAWSDEQLLGWYLLEIEGGGRSLDLWILANGDDGAVFERGEIEPCGIAVAQSAVYDTREDRAALCRALQRALDAFDLPPFEEWSRSAGHPGRPRPK